MKRILFVALLAAGLAACSEQPQTAGTGKKADAKAWEGANNAYAAEGWKPGDEASWEQQMRKRAQAQNEYERSPAQR